MVSAAKAMIKFKPPPRVVGWLWELRSRSRCGAISRSVADAISLGDIEQVFAEALFDPACGEEGLTSEIREVYNVSNSQDDRFPSHKTISHSWQYENQTAKFGNF